MFDAKNLKELRNELNMSQREFIKILGVSEGSYALWESNREIIPIKRLLFICEKFNISLDYLLGFQDVEKEMDKKFNLEKQGERLKLFRRDNNLTQVEIEKVLNSSKGVFCNYEKNKIIVSTVALYTICSKYGVRADYLLGRIDEPRYRN